MKKLIFYTAFLVLGMNSSLTGQFHLNLSAGLNSSNVKYVIINEIPTVDRFAYFIGVAPSYKLNDRIRFQIDAQYSLKGFDQELESIPSTLSTRLGYLDFLPEIEYYLFDNVALGLGFNYGVNISGQGKFDNDDWSDSAEIVESTDFGLTGKLKFIYKHIFGFVRYNYGVSNNWDNTFMLTDADGNPIEDIEQFNRNLQIGIGYEFEFNKN